MSRSLHPQGLEHRIHGVGIEARLELGKKLARHGGNVTHAGHREQPPLQGLGKVLNGPDQIFVDAKGNVVVAECSSSTEFPVTAAAIQPKNASPHGK